MLISKKFFIGKSIQFLISAIILAIYGVEVCPFIESLPKSTLRINFFVVFTITLIFYLILSQLWQKKIQSSSVFNLKHSWIYLLIEVGMWVVAGLVITFWNYFQYDFPIIYSGGKMLIACLTVGLLSAVYSLLIIENNILIRSELDTKRQVLEKSFYLPVTTKALLFFVLVAVTVSVALLLLIHKDFIYVIENVAKEPLDEVAMEIGFVFLVVFGFIFLILFQYLKNLNRLFQFQLKVLNQVKVDKFDVFVPIINYDEFGVIADETNEMILKLKEKAKIKSIFGKFLSPIVAKSILDTDLDIGLGGEEKDVAIFFSDIRDYTTLSESCQPTELVALLNKYFTLVVSIIHKNNGTLDKFIGDAAMAIFGLDGCDASNMAIKSALEIKEELIKFNLNQAKMNLPQLKNGIGIHFGKVLAGNIGSEERLEYTVIGDTVNVAARLESLTKKINSTIVISKEVYQKLDNNFQDKFVNIGNFELKGKSVPITTFGLEESLK